MDKSLPIKASLFINGSFSPASDDHTFDLHSPYSGEKSGKVTVSAILIPAAFLTIFAVAEASIEDDDRAVEAAKAAQLAWEALSPQQRGKPLAKLAQLVEDATPELARLDALALGRHISTYFDGHYAVTHFRYFAEAAYGLGTSSLNTPGFMNVSLRQPYGVGAAIIPWNAPLVFLSKKLAPALPAGNTMVLKTSEKAPLSSYRVAQMINEAGFPKGVVNILHGHGLPSGDAIARHMNIRALSFTGSVRMGRAIQKAAAETNFKHLVFELGGKSPTIVFEDADLERAAQETQNSIMFHSGQTCMANSRIYVQADIADAFIEKFNAFAKARKLGDPLDAETTSGPQADKAQFETVPRFIDEAKRAGGKVLETGTPLPEKNGDHFVQPTVFLNHPEHDKLAKEEVSGPVVIINTFEKEEEVLKVANDTEYGLYAVVYTLNIDRALRVAKKLQSGMVGVNCTSPTGAWDMPFGGCKQSGVGRESLVESLGDWLETKSVFIRMGGSNQVGAGKITLGR